MVLVYLDFVVLSWFLDAFLRRLGHYQSRQTGRAGDISFRRDSIASASRLHRVREGIYGDSAALAIPMHPVCKSRAWWSSRVRGKPVGACHCHGSSPLVSGELLAFVFPEVKGCETSEDSSLQ